MHVQFLVVRQREKISEQQIDFVERRCASNRPDLCFIPKYLRMSVLLTHQTLGIYEHTLLPRPRKGTFGNIPASSNGKMDKRGYAVSKTFVRGGFRFPQRNSACWTLTKPCVHRANIKQKRETQSRTYTCSKYQQGGWSSYWHHIQPWPRSGARAVVGGAVD